MGEEKRNSLYYLIMADDNHYRKFDIHFARVVATTLKQLSLCLILLLKFSCSDGSANGVTLLVGCFVYRLNSNGRHQWIITLELISPTGVDCRAINAAWQRC